MYISIIYTPNLGLEIAVSVREREQGRFRGSSEGARGSIEGARGSSEGARGSIEGAGGSTEGAAREHERARGSTMGQCRGAASGSLKWLSSSWLELPLLLVCCLDFATSHRILLTAI